MIVYKNFSNWGYQREKEGVSLKETKVLIDLSAGEILCISNDDEKLKKAMYQQLIDGGHEFDCDMYELRNWGEYDFEIYKYSPRKDDDVVFLPDEDSNSFVSKLKSITQKNTDYFKEGYLALIPDIKISNRISDHDFDELRSSFDSLDQRDKFNAIAYSSMYYRDLLIK